MVKALRGHGKLLSCFFYSWCPECALHLRIFVDLCSFVFLFTLFLLILVTIINHEDDVHVRVNLGQWIGDANILVVLLSYILRHHALFGLRRCIYGFVAANELRGLGRRFDVCHVAKVNHLHVF